MAATLLPNTELVAVALLGESEFFGTDSYCATRLPVADGNGNYSWMSTGFVVVSGIGGTSSNEVAMNNPVVAVDCFAAPKKAGADPPWRVAVNLAETIRNGCRQQKQHILTLPAQFPQARIFTTFLVTEPRRLPDPAGIARYTFQMQVNWGPL